MANVSSWSTTAASNNSTPPDGFPEGMAANTLNDAAREVMAAVAKWYSDADGSLASTGSSNAYVLTSNSSHAALADQSLLVFRANHANTGAATLNVDTLGAKAIKKNHDEALASGDIEANQIVVVAYNATDDVYELISSPVLGTAATVNTGTTTGDVPVLDSNAVVVPVVGGMPIGAVMPFAGSSAPTGWLLCDGSAVSRTTYAKLFAVISTTYGVGDGSTTFDLPDATGRVIAGKEASATRLTSGGSGVDGATLGASGGSETHTLTQAQLPSYNLVFPGSARRDATGIGLGSVIYDNVGTTNVPSGGSGTAMNNTQPTLVLNQVIFAGA